MFYIVLVFDEFLLAYAVSVMRTLKKVNLVVMPNLDISPRVIRLTDRRIDSGGSSELTQILNIKRRSDA